MATATRKIIKSVTLQTGEKFVLPPLAVLKGATNSESFTSSCPVPQLETLTCYIAIIGTNEREGNTTGFYEGDQSAIIGYRMNGIEGDLPADYRGANPSGAFDLDAVTAGIQAAIGGIIATASATHGGNDGRGQLSYILIQTVPSIANSLELLVQSTSPMDVDPQGNTAAISRYPFRTRAAVISDGYEGLPDCPDVELT